MNGRNGNSHIVHKKLLLLSFADKAADKQSSNAKDAHEISMQIGKNDSSLLLLNSIEVYPKFAGLGSTTE